MTLESLNFALFHLRCEDLENPMGIDSINPHLSWKLIGGRRGLKQTAYQIQCSTDPNKFEADELLWDTRKIKSTESIHIKYLGAPLKSRQKIYWRVKAWDELDKKSYIRLVCKVDRSRNTS
jgi:alpha-L-rhamnosidase